MTEIIIKNGTIYTMNPKLPKVNALAIRDGKFMYVGDNINTLKLAKKDSKIIDPINIISPQISLPIYVASLASENKIIEMQYFLLDGELDKDSDSQEYIQTEISEILKFKTPSNSFVNNFIIGFMLDKKQKELLN